MKRKAEDLRLQRVTFFGPVHGAAKDALYRGSDVFVLPTHAENFGLVVAEALAQEVPVITTTNAPWSGLDEKRCGWWIPLSQHRLKDSIADAMSRPQADLQAMGARGRTWIQTDFAPEHVAAKNARWFISGFQGGQKNQSMSMNDPEGIRNVRLDLFDQPRIFARRLAT